MSKELISLHLQREVYVRLPDEDHEEDMCGKLNKSMYGTRDAASNWETEYVTFMRSCGFEQGKSSPCIFYHRGKDIRAVIYGDDFTLLGSDSALNWFRSSIKVKYEVSIGGRLGPDDGDDKSVRILNRVIEWTDKGISYEADQRHAEIIIKQLEVNDMKPLSVPGSKAKPKECSDWDLEELEPSQATLFRGLVARANYLSQDRSDIRFAVKSLARWMSKPRNIDMKGLVDLGRYLKNKLRVVNEYQYQKNWKIMDVWTDTDHAGCPWSRKSTSGGVIIFGTHTIKHWSNTQTVISISSGEAEYYGCVRAASTAIGIQSLISDLGII